MIDSFAPVNPALIDVRLPQHDGYPEAMRAMDTPDVLRGKCGSASREFPQALWVEPSDWEDVARENDKFGTWPINYIDRFTNQNPSHECTCHSLSRAFECARNATRGVMFADGPKKGFRYTESGKFGSVWVSPLSVYAEANPGQWGGASCGEVLEIAIERGFLPEKIQPREYGFKHDLQGTTGKGGLNQSSGAWVKLSQFPAGHRETSKHFRILEVVFPSSAEQIAAMVLKGRRCVCVGRDGHAIPYSLFKPREKLMGYVDSYDVVRWDSWGTVRSAVGGAYAVMTVTVPDDWDKPAG